jgi:hypothetical protein
VTPFLGEGRHMVEFKLNVCWCDSTVNFSMGYIILVVLLLEPNHLNFLCGKSF